MDSVEFNEPGSNLAQRAPASQKASISAYIIRIGLAKDIKEAERMLLVLAVFLLIATIFVWVFVAPKKAPTIPPPVAYIAHEILT